MTINETELGVLRELIVQWDEYGYAAQGDGVSDAFWKCRAELIEAIDGLTNEPLPAYVQDSVTA